MRRAQPEFGTSADIPRRPRARFSDGLSVPVSFSGGATQRIFLTPNFAVISSIVHAEELTPLMLPILHH